ncbi:MAG: methyl-accepting chemotaxis protein [Rhodospirillaceae bacterium]|nr:MAG: methyl-accepting chemotaxis protein [Rhodospirillaceae bacterium]
MKNLASQTARATGEISQHISAVQGATRETVEAIHGIGATIAAINQIAISVTVAMEKQGASTEEIAHNVRNVSDNAGMVAGNMISVTQTAAASYGASIQVIWSANDLAQPIKILQGEIDAFLTKVRTN